MVLIDHIKRLEIEEDRLPILEALILLEEVNTQTIRSKDTGSCRIRIYNHKNLLLHAMELQFPLSNAIEEVISAQYQVTTSKKIVRKNKKVTNHKKAKRSFQFRKTKVHLITAIKRLWFVVVIVCSFFVFMKLTYHHFFEKKNQEENVKMIEERKEFIWLKEINDQYPTKDAQFDLAFFENDWHVVINIQPENLTDKRQVMLAFAYLELNQFAEAEILNKRLVSDELQAKLDQSYFEQGLTLLKEQKISETKKNLEMIQAEELRGLLQVYIEHASIMIDFIELYQQNEDQENQLLWEQRLKKLGEEEKQ